MKDAEHREVLDHVLGKKSSSWGKWREQMRNLAKLNGTDEGSFIIAACTAALLQLGPPPHPEWLTTDTQSIYPHPRFKTRSDRIHYERIMKSQMSSQFRWNKAFNSWVVENQLFGSNPSHGPAQLRKYFAAWWLLHRCKKHGEHGEAGNGSTTSPIKEMAATRDALAKHRRVLHGPAVRGRGTAKNVS